MPFICEKNFLIIIIYAFISYEQKIHYYKLWIKKKNIINFKYIKKTIIFLFSKLIKKKFNI